MPQLEETCRVLTSPEKTFEFFLRPQLVVEISDPAAGFKLVNAPEVLSTGDEYDVQFIAFGTVRTVKYRAHVDPGSLVIVETMIQGDLRAWEHRKTFVVDGSETVLTDSIVFEPPGGLAGFLMTAEKIEDDVADGLAYRNSRLASALQAFAD